MAKKETAKKDIAAKLDDVKEAKMKALESALAQLIETLRGQRQAGIF